MRFPTLAPSLLLLAAALDPSPARADDLVVWARLPAERHAELASALRLELAGRATLTLGAPVDPEGATVAAMREEARAAGATHAVWVVFPGGILAPAEVRVLDVARTSAAHAMAPQAWDVVDPRVVAVLAASLIDAASSEPAAVETAVVVVEPSPTRAVGDEATSAAEAGESSAAAVEARPERAEAPAASEDLTLVPPDPRRARTFSFSLGPALAHISRPGSATELALTGQLAFYGRVSEWASIGLRFRGGGGASSIEGAIFTGSVAVPSIAVGFREALGTAAMLELGVHTEGGLFVDYSEREVRGANQLSFGLGVGAFATLELGTASAIQLDYTLEMYGFGASGTWSWGNATLAYVYRWD